MKQSLEQKVLDDPTELCRHYFKNDDGEPLELLSYQAEIISTILKRESKRNLCWAATQAGKSLAIAIGIILLAVTWNGRKIRIVAPTHEHTTIIMNYIIQHILDHEDIINQLDLAGELTGKKRKAEALKRQISKRRITWKNNSEIQIITASIATKGRSLIGAGATDLFIDEAEQIPIEIVDNRIMRMLGATPDACVFMISNPSAKGFMYKAMKDTETWSQIRIGWKQCVEEGRLSEKFIMERKRAMTSAMFTLWYESQYPDDLEGSMIPWKFIERAVYEVMPKFEAVEHKIGLDVAAGGADLNVLTHVAETELGNYVIVDIKDWSEPDLMKTVGRSFAYMVKHKITNGKFDDTALVGVADRLREVVEEKKMDIEIQGINFGRSALDKNQYANAKAEMYGNMTWMFKENKIHIPDHPELKEQLDLLRYKHTSAGKFMYDDELEQKSPDFADSLALALYERKGSMELISDEDMEGIF